jgi:UPF0755 protein
VNLGGRGGRSGLSSLRRLAISGASALITLAAALAVLVAAALWAFNGAGPEARTGQATTVILRPGAGLSEIASTLQRAGVIRSAPLFSAGAQLTGAARSLKAGEYLFPSRSSMSQVLDKIHAGKVVRHFVTVPEGWTSEMVIDILMAEPILTGTAPVPPEGALLPETYEVRRGEDRAAVLQRMMDARERLLGEIWAQRKPDLPFSTPEEAVTLASIVEKETSVAAERPRIAAVFVNRLRQGMRLQSDPTIIYGISRGRPLGRGILLSELTAPTPYNTYAIDGLPPTPIGNPGKASLVAVLAPLETEDLYFVADGSGGHAFAATLEEHERNVARWRQLEAASPAAAPVAPAPAAVAPKKAK